MVRVDFYATAVNRELEHGKLPNLSHDLESVRAYQFELVFNALSNISDKILSSHFS